MTMKSELPSDRERIETEIIKSLIESYFNIVRKNFLDLVPKTIMYVASERCEAKQPGEERSTVYVEASLRSSFPFVRYSLTSKKQVLLGQPREGQRAERTRQ